MNEGLTNASPIPAWRVIARRNDRTVYRDLNSLAASIQKDGLIQPMVMRPIDVWVSAHGRTAAEPFDGALQALEPVAGQRRFRAITTILGLTELPAGWVKVQAMDDRTADDLMLMENSERVDLNPMDISDGYQYRVGRYEMTVEDLCALTKKTGSHVRLMLSLQRLVPEVQEWVRQEVMPVTFAEFMVNLPTEAQRQAMQLYSRLDGNMTRQQWRTYVQEIDKEADDTEQMGLLTDFWQDQISEQKFAANGRFADLGDVPISQDAPDVRILRSSHDHAGAIIFRYIKTLEADADPRHRESAAVLGKVYQALVYSRKVRVPAPTLQ